MAQIQPPRAMGEAMTAQSEDSVWSERTNPDVKAPAKEKEIRGGSGHRDYIRFLGLRDSDDFTGCPWP